MERDWDVETILNFDQHHTQIDIKRLVHWITYSLYVQMIFDQLYKLDFIFCSQFVEENSFKAAFCEGR